MNLIFFFFFWAKIVYLYVNEIRAQLCQNDDHKAE